MVANDQETATTAMVTGPAEGVAVRRVALTGGAVRTNEQETAAPTMVASL